MEYERARIEASELLVLLITEPVEAEIEIHALETVLTLQCMAARVVGLEYSDGRHLQLHVHGCSPAVIEDRKQTLQHAGIRYRAQIRVLGDIEKIRCARYTARNADIHSAAASGELEKVQMIVKYCSDRLTETDANGDTPLHVSVYSNVAVARLLLHAKCDPNARNKVSCH